VALREQLDVFLKNISTLGTRRLISLSAMLFLLMAGIGVLAVYLNRPAFETLYVGLDRDDVNRVGIALSEAGFKFDVDNTGTAVLVAAGSASRARMILAEKGLPASSGAGYELFDNLGSLGLTSFMQEVTRVRAIEGELARSIQAIDGVKAARVHIVIPNRTAFRDRDRKPTASILIKAANDQITSKANAVRHLVAAAVPGLASDDVMIMDATGKLLASGQDQFSNALSGSLDIQRNIETDIEEKISLALSPQVGGFNYRVAIHAQIDTDRSSTKETIFDPASRVERSVQVVKAEDSSTQKSESQVTSVEQNLPLPKPVAPASGPVTAETSQKREETTNYEINSKHVDTERNGYRIQRLSISVVLNKAKLIEILGPNAQQADIDVRLAEIQKSVSSAAGFDAERGDNLNVAATEFVDDAVLPAASAGIIDQISVHTGTIINAASFFVVALLVLFMGVRPLIRTLSKEVAPSIFSDVGAQSTKTEASAGSGAEDIAGNRRPEAFRHELDSGSASPMHTADSSPAERLQALTELDSERTTLVLRKWLLEEAA
jgi:flagellar M-ring protein FliF